VKVPNDERVANDIGPESCAAAREGRREALTEVRSGWPLSRESKLQSADAVSKAEGHMDGGANASLRPALRGLRPQHGRTFPAQERDTTMAPPKFLGSHSRIECQRSSMTAERITFGRYQVSNPAVSASRLIDAGVCADHGKKAIKASVVVHTPMDI
jgi:hypothetical protein